jgi:Arc/MetJ family transcription regulator
MRTSVVIDDNLMALALKSSGCKSKRAAIEAGLRLLVHRDSQKKLRDLKGKVTWEGDLEDMRRN